jgi:hypothetical protein
MRKHGETVRENRMFFVRVPKTQEFPEHSAPLLRHAGARVFISGNCKTSAPCRVMGNVNSLIIEPP